MVAESSQRQLEPLSENIWKYLERNPVEDFEQPLQRGGKRAAKHVLISDETLFRRTTLSLKVVVQLSRWPAILTTFHVDIGYWEKGRTRKFITKRFWRLSVQKDVIQLICSCDDC